MIEMIKVTGGLFEFNGIEQQISDFSIGKYPVTQKQWEEVLEKGLYKSNPSYFQHDENCPVESVSWDHVQDFITILNRQTGLQYRLPSEMEWEFAARGGNLSNGYQYAGSNNLDEVGWYSKNSNRQTHPVGQKKPNELGLHDMSGNVWELCINKKTANSFFSYVLRGGGCFNNDSNCRSASRIRLDPGSWGNFLGFRLVHE